MFEYLFLMYGKYMLWFDDCMKKYNILQCLAILAFSFNFESSYRSFWCCWMSFWIDKNIYIGLYVNIRLQALNPMYFKAYMFIVVLKV
jgi:hypothetical protein